MQLFTNNAVSTIATGISDSDVSLTLATGDGAKFPSLSGGDTFVATITQAGTETSWEIVSVTARSSDTLTIVRAQEGTSASAWAAGSKVEIRLTAAAAQSGANAGGGGGGSLPAGGVTGAVLAKNSADDGDASWSMTPSLTSMVLHGPSTDNALKVYAGTSRHAGHFINDSASDGSCIYAQGSNSSAAIYATNWAGGTAISANTDYGVALYGTSAYGVGIRVSASSDTCIYSENEASSFYSATFIHYSGSGARGLDIWHKFSNPGGNFIRARDSSGDRFTLAGNGDCANTNGVYGTISDASLKENIQTARDYTNDFKRLRFCRFSFKADQSKVPTLFGLIADDVESVFPGLVRTQELTVPTGNMVDVEVRAATEDSPADVRQEAEMKEIMVKYVAQSVIHSIGMSVLQRLIARVEALERAAAATSAKPTS